MFYQCLAQDCVDGQVFNWLILVSASSPTAFHLNK